MATPTQNSPYRKLAGTFLGAFTVKKLWQGPDHLLLVETSLARERYRRFYYNDIQAVVLRQTGTFRTWTWVWTVLIVLAALIAAVFAWPRAACVLFGGVCTVILAVHLMRGHTCEVRIQTAVQMHPLGMLKRRRPALAVMDRIKPLVEGAQGGVSIRDIPVTPSGTPVEYAEQEGGATRLLPGRTDSDVTTTPFIPLLHRLLFGLLLIAGICRAVELRFDYLLLALLDMVLLAATLVLAMVAIVRWFRHTRGTRLAVLSWFCLALTVLHALAGYIFFMVVTFQNPGLSFNQWALIRIFLESKIVIHPVARMAHVVLAVASAGLGILGLWELRHVNREVRQ
jgi:hypothetical protein